jgi:hypothetical protein
MSGDASHGRRGPRAVAAAASDTKVFTDKAEVRAVWRPYIALDGRSRRFNITPLIEEDQAARAVEDAKRRGEEPPRYDHPPQRRVWHGGRSVQPESGRPEEDLYRDYGDQGQCDRWILVFPGRDDLLNRELTDEAAAYWLGLIYGYHPLPLGLTHIRPRGEEAAYPRLHPNWRPRRGPSTQSEGCSLHPKLVVSRNPPRATLGDAEFNLNGEQAAFVQILWLHMDRWVEPKVFEADSLLRGCRRDRIKKSLPKPLRDIIKGKPGGGYRISLA